MLKREEEICSDAVRDAAREIMLAVRTSPKTRGMDNMTIFYADADHKEQIVAKMDEVFEKSGGKRASFARDAKGVVAAEGVLLVGVKTPAYGLNCAWCGFESCAAKPVEVPCVFPAVDLGIGCGVAAARLSDKHIDNRMMFSIGYAALQLGWFPPDVTLALGFPLSVTGKNPYFDR